MEDAELEVGNFSTNVEFRIFAQESLEFEQITDGDGSMNGVPFGLLKPRVNGRHFHNIFKLIEQNTLLIAPRDRQKIELKRCLSYTYLGDLILRIVDFQCAGKNNCVILIFGLEPKAVFFASHSCVL